MSIQGKTIVFTGKISKPRYEFQKLVEKYGGIAGSDITGRTNFLVVGEKPGSKLARAAALNVRCLTESQFLSLLEDSKEVEDEVPLSSEELEGLKASMVTLTCSFCNSQYRQWKSLPNYETCPKCQIFSNPKCPHCGSPPIFVTDLKLYHCMICGKWFKGPFSIKASKTKHLHFFIGDKIIQEGIYKKCLICDSTIFLSKEDEAYHTRRYEEAPKLVEQREREKEALRIIESLTPDQIKELERRIASGAR